MTGTNNGCGVGDVGSTNAPGFDVDSGEGRRCNKRIRDECEGGGGGNTADVTAYDALLFNDTIPCSDPECVTTFSRSAGLQLPALILLL